MESRICKNYENLSKLGFFGESFSAIFLPHIHNSTHIQRASKSGLDKIVRTPP